MQEKIVTSGSQTTEYLTFLYNSEGPTGFVYNNTVYTYRKNIFEDIIAVYNGTSKVAEYAYDAKLRRVIMPTSQSLATVIDYTYDYSGQVTKTNRYNQAITTSDTNVAFNQSQQATSSLTVEQTQKDEYQRTTKTTATCNDITLVNSCTYESFVTDAVTQEKTEVKSGNSTLGTVQTDYTTDALKRLQSVKVTVNGNGYSRDIAYIPRQTRTQLPNPGGGGGTIEPWSLNSIGYKTETVGTTYYPSLVTTKELRNNSAVETETLSLTYDANGNITTYGYNT